MQVKVYHRENLDPRETADFTPVAIVEAPTADVDEALEYAYRYTNNINGSWSRGETFEFGGETHENPDFNSNVTFIGQLPVGKDGTVYGARSTSMMDMMAVDGQLYEVAAFGFKKLHKVTEEVA